MQEGPKSLRGFSATKKGSKSLPTIRIKAAKFNATNSLPEFFQGPRESVFEKLQKIRDREK